MKLNDTWLREYTSSYSHLSTFHIHENYTKECQVENMNETSVNNSYHVVVSTYVYLNTAVDFGDGGTANKYICENEECVLIGIIAIEI